LRLLFVADGRSPIAQSWMEHFVEADHEVHLLSTSPLSTQAGFASVEFVSIAFGDSRLASALAANSGSSDSVAHGGPARMWLRSIARHWVGPFTVSAAARRADSLIRRIQPDLIHALRIPFEGILAASANTQGPLILSSWGNDFTLHARSSPGMGRLTRRALRRADGLITDCQNDVGNARDWGYSPEKETLVVPGNGGVRTDIFHPNRVPAPSPRSRIWLESIPEASPVVINPRGIRSYVRNDTFFEALPAILAEFPQTVFLCPGMAGEPEAEAWSRRLDVGRSIRLLPRLQAEEMAAVFRRADVSVSPSEHDGTPNTLLEAMACGCFPVAGDLVSIREWIEPGANGLLFNPARPESLVQAVLEALGAPALLARAAEVNTRLVSDWADYADGMSKAEAFYREVVQCNTPDRGNGQRAQRRTPAML
jgi:glycosyltransferase involved in cell wall biosynthesis